MRRLRTSVLVALTLFVAGAALMLASTGGYDTTVADRTAVIETEPDANAILELTYPDQDQQALYLEDDCGWFGCNYYAEEVVTFEDRTQAQELDIVDATFSFQAHHNISQIESIGDSPTLVEDGDSLGVVLDSYACESTGGSQDPGEGTLTMDLVVSDGTLTIELTREITIVCVEDSG